MKSLFRFRQDLRIFDNVWFYNAYKQSDEIIPVFIIDENILSRFPSDDKRLIFLRDALINLDFELKKKWSNLLIKKWDPVKLIPKIIEDFKVDKLFFNKSYWSYWTLRDKNIINSINILHEWFLDYLLVEPSLIPARKVFTPFYKIWKTLLNNFELLEIEWKINSPKINNNIKLLFNDVNTFNDFHWDIKKWYDILNEYDYSAYSDNRNFPYLDKTSKLSPYLRFWIISIRNLYMKLLSKNLLDDTFLSEIAWREFWNNIAINFPFVNELEFLEKRRWILWKNNSEYFKARTEWRTWYPLVDAWMRQLKKENWMHNRVRMVVASFLTKDLLVDRRLWERHFENYLIDYDRNINIWNWQWSSSVWADPKPLRIFNPMLQSERFDPNCNYIKKYLPELSEFSPKEIHNPLKYDLLYSKPIVDHFEMSKIAKNMYLNNNI